GRLVGGGMVRERLRAMFAYRHTLTRSDLVRHARFADRPRLTVAVTGSRGLVGSELVPFLTSGGHRVIRLVTGSTAPPFDDGTTWVSWKPDAPVAPSVFEGVDAVIHLAGDNVAEGRWNDAKRKRILDSRSIPTRHLAQAVAAVPADRRPRAFVCASAVGFYGSRGAEELTESSPAGEGFFPEVAKVWEAACDPARDAGVRVVNLRIGVVLSPKGGALGKQLLAFKMGGGATLGGGEQFVPWVTIGDTVGALHHALMREGISGPVNLVGPHPVTNHAFTKTLGRVLGRPAFLWLPRTALRVMFGAVADEALLASMNARPARLLTDGFAFDHPDLEAGLRFLLGR
ncbi:MAG: TIGR01777 family oxidoreductase, partial [Gemmataceae bacterium]|nr:TIGR01777 family oxidoreductase [Gemmataceae bacterium]